MHKRMRMRKNKRRASRDWTKAALLDMKAYIQRVKTPNTNAYRKNLGDDHFVLLEDFVDRRLGQLGVPQ